MKKRAITIIAVTIWTAFISWVMVADYRRTKLKEQINLYVDSARMYNGTPLFWKYYNKCDSLYTVVYGKKQTP